MLVEANVTELDEHFVGGNGPGTAESIVQVKLAVCTYKVQLAVDLMLLRR